MSASARHQADHNRRVTVTFNVAAIDYAKIEDLARRFQLSIDEVIRHAVLEVLASVDERSLIDRLRAHSSVTRHHPR